MFLYLKHKAIHFSAENFNNEPSLNKLFSNQISINFTQTGSACVRDFHHRLVKKVVVFRIIFKNFSDFPQLNQPNVKDCMECTQDDIEYIYRAMLQSN